MTKFPKISCSKITEGIFIGPRIRKLINDEEFIATLKEDEKNAWLALIDIVKHFSGNNKSPSYVRIVENLISKFHKLECITNLKFNFMDSHLNFSPDNLGAESEEQGERFHQDIKIIEHRYNGLWNQRFDAKDWPSWKQQFSRYRLLSNLNAKEQEYQITALIYWEYK
ncbi:hypothetical protein LAZ67_8001268 [Cordylochernes scorpioides]|uniref:Uncharacterized protein n=1 Tax=Cordylochernes scorpioides TaxID=51811 RepID=A0ABY6KS06_9ARAC|nr:hypothetical protein LAZ67_8001268 [Cordylochernes scorpioides]